MGNLIHLLSDPARLVSVFLDTSEQDKVILASPIQVISAVRGVFDPPKDWHVYCPAADCDSCNLDIRGATQERFMEFFNCSPDEPMPLDDVRIPIETKYAFGYRFRVGVNYQLHICVIPQNCWQGPSTKSISTAAAGS